MKRLGDHDASRSWGPQTTAIPVGGTIAWMVGATALLFGVAYEVPEIAMWATYALPASLVISVLYVAARRWQTKPPTTLHLDQSPDLPQAPTATVLPPKPTSQRPFHDAIASY